VDYRHKKIARILLDMGHTKWRPCTGGQEKETENFKEVDVLSVQELILKC
jgi:hypothetical protein